MVFIVNFQCGAKILCFSLDEPQILVGNRNKIIASDNTSVHYIDYTNDTVTEDVNDNLVAFPSEWKGKHTGKNIIMRNNREAVLTNLSEDDIKEEGTPVNDSVASLLTYRQELVKELNELLQTM